MRAVLLLLLSALVTGSWVDVGEKNIRNLKGMFEISKDLQNKVLSKAVWTDLQHKMGAHFADRVDCNQNAGMRMGFALQDVPISRCFEEASKVSHNLALGEYDLKDLAITPENGGRTILVYFTRGFSGITSSGEHVPGTEFRDAVNNGRFHFDDEGRVSGYDLESQTELVEQVSRTVTRYEEHREGPEELLAIESWARVGEDNLASVKKLVDIQRQMQGKVVSMALMNDLQKQVVSFYAPKLSCSFMKGTHAGFELEDTTLSHCNQVAAKTFAGLKLGQIDLKNIAIDPATGGKTILSYNTQDVSGMTSSGENVPSSEVNGMIVNVRYHFDDNGLVSSYDAEFQSDLVDHVFQAVAAYEKEHGEALQDATQFSSLAFSSSPSLAFAAGFLFAAFAGGLATFVVVKNRRAQPALLEGYVPS